MSTFKGLVHELGGVSIDRFSKKNLKSEVFFLSHCHVDHMEGLDTTFVTFLKSNQNKNIYMSKVSSVLIKVIVPGISDFVKPLSINEPHLIKIPLYKGNADVYVNVTLIPAGHCPGSVMFLFEDLDDKCLLYTGDFRLTINELRLIKPLHKRDGTPKNIHKMYFDSTFWNEKYADFPNRNESCDILCNIIKEWVSKGREYIVYLKIPARYGSEYLFMEIYKRLKMAIFVNYDVYQAYKQLVDMDGTITIDANDTQIYCSNTLIKKYSYNKSYKIRTVLPSALRWTYFNKDIFEKENKNNKFNICYSSHCSFNELKKFLDYLKPEEIEPCVVRVDNPEDFYNSINDYCKRFLKTTCSYLIQIDNNIENNAFINPNSECDELISVNSSSDSENEAIVKSESNISKLISSSIAINSNNVNKCKKIKFF